MGTNSILTFAGSASGTNILTDSAYSTDTDRPIGHQPGIARQELENKALKQVSLVAASVAQFIADLQSNNITDALTTENIAQYFGDALFSHGHATDTGTANAYVAALSPAPAALTPGMIVAVDGLVASNTGASTLNLNGLGALPIQSAGGAALQGGELVAGYGAIFRLNKNATAAELVYTSGGIQAGAFIGGNKAVFTANGSFTVPGGVTKIWVSACGGGGGGGGGGGSSGSSGSGGGGGGGGAGQSVLKYALTVAPGDVLSVTIGAGGASGTASTSGLSGGNGSGGGASSVGTVLLTGGSGGFGGANSSIHPPGGSSGAGFPDGSDGSDTTAETAGTGSGGAGASSPFGGGGGAGRSAYGSGGFAGAAAFGYGGGGGGGGGSTQAGAGNGGNGGNGAPGIVIIEW